MISVSERESSGPTGQGGASASLVVLTPAFLGAGTGAATYYQLLVSALRGRNWGVTVVSERTDGPAPPGFIPLFRSRSVRDRTFFRDALTLLAQQWAFRELAPVLRDLRPRSLLVHSSLHRFPNTLGRTLDAWRSSVGGIGSVTIADVRDRAVPRRRLGQLARYDHVIACSANVRRYLIDGGVPEERIVQIPVPQEAITIGPDQVRTTLARHGLADAPYIFYAGLIKEVKAVGDLLTAFVTHVRPRRPDCRLVLAGHLKTSSPGIRRLLGADGVSYLGALSRQEVLELTAGAAVCANLSPNEGMPRSSLEALELGRPTVLPPGVPEFDQHCSRFVAPMGDIEGAAELMLELLDTGEVPRYPLENHRLDHLLGAYEQVLQAR